MLFVLDIETSYKKKHVINSVGLVSKKNLKCLQSEYALFFCINYLLNKAGNVFAHNFSNFDSFFIIQTLLKLNIKILKIFIKNNSIIFLKCVYKKNVIYFRDSFLFFNYSLAYILKIFNKNKCYIHLLKKKFILKYLCFDLIGLLYFISTVTIFINNVYMINILKFIAMAQLTFHIYIKHFLKKFISFLSVEIFLLIKRNLVGQKFIINNSDGKNIYLYDINSLYPFVMRKLLPFEF
jgi:hypothetical protein